MDNQLPLVSIIIPLYNREELISETINSIIHQTYKNWECIIVDDHSTDETLKVIENFVKIDKRFKILIRPKDRQKGANACRNYGFEKSNGTYINWFDSDDLMHPEKLERQVISLNKNPDEQFTVCQTLVFEHTLNNIIGLRKESIYSKDFFNDFICNKIKWLTQAPLIRKAFLLEHSIQFDESLFRSQERDFFIKVLNKTKSYHFDETPLVYFRKHSDSISFGNETIEKIKSSFKVNIRILKVYQSKISKKSIEYLKKKLKSEIVKILIKKDYLSGIDLLNNYKNIVQPNFLEFVKLKIGYFSIKYFGKGERFFK